MELDDIKQLYADKRLRESPDSLTEVSNYDLVVTYYRHLGLDPYKLRGKTGSVLRAKIKNSPAFQAWAKTYARESVEVLTAELTEKDKTKEQSDKPFDAKKAVKVTFFGYPGKKDKNFKQSDSVKDETGTNFNYISPN